MKIKRLDLLAFGPFTQKSLDFSEGNPGLHVIQGPNEAGKSSTLRALKAWLFGIDARSSDNFIHDHKQLRVGGVLQSASGHQLACIRRKGNKDTLLDSVTEQPIGEDALSKLLPGLDERLFSQLHGIDHPALVQGGQDILQQSGDLGKSLFGAALGSRGNADLLGQLTAEADKLFRQRGQTQSINAAIAKFKDAKREEKQETVSVKEWKELQKSLQEAEDTVAKIDEQLAQARRNKSKLERFKRVAAPLAERRQLLRQQAELSDAMLLPADFASRRQAALDKLALARERREKTSAKLARVQKEAQELHVPQGLLENQAAIEDLQLQLGAYQKSAKDKPAQDAKRRDHRNAAQSLLASIRPDLKLESAETLMPLLTRKKHIDSLAQKSSLLQQKSGQLKAQLRALQDEEASLRQQPEAHFEPGKETTSLIIAIKAARSSGDLAAMIRKAREAGREQEQACTLELQRLGRFQGSLEALVRLPMPERALLDSFETQFDQQNELSRELHRQQAGAAQELRQHEESLKTLLHLSQVPTLQELQAARSHREQGWALVRSKYIERTDPAAAIAQYADNKDLASAYETAVLAADQVADRLRIDAQRVQQRASLETQIQARRELLSQLQLQFHQLAAAKSQLDHQWQAVWQGIADKVGTPKEMKEWLLRVEQLLQRNAQLQRIRTDLRSLEATQAGHLQAIAAELHKLGQAQDGKTPELEALLAWSEQFLRQEDAVRRRHAEIQAALQKIQFQLKALAEARRQAHDERQHWQAAWRDAVDGLGLGTNPQPELALATMEKLEQLFKELAEAEVASKRVYGMDKDEQRFREAVAQLTQRIGLPLGEQSAADVTQSLVRQLGKVLADSASLEKLQAQIRELEGEVADADQEIQLAERSLAQLRHEACVTADDQLGPVIERSAQKRKIDLRLEALQQQIHQYGDGHSIQELEQESQGLDSDEVGDRLIQLEAKLSELSQERDDKRDQRQRLSVRLQAMDGSSKAAEAAERAEQLLAGIVPDAEQYLRFTIARLILEEQMERYRQENQTPVLRRAGQLFAKLTLGSFTGLRDELDSNGKPLLLGVRPNKTEVGVEGMSDGTRDQLFLALRLATIELRQGQQDPLPFVVDDILVGFDDQRSQACLEVLAEFAKKTQVLVFTHHTMVAKAAHQLGKEKGVYVHELAG